MQAMYSAVHLEKFALTETAGYWACWQRDLQNIGIPFLMETHKHLRFRQ
jgi:hypothetical protein